MNLPFQTHTEWKVEYTRRGTHTESESEYTLEVEIGIHKEEDTHTEWKVGYTWRGTHTEWDMDTHTKCKMGYKFLVLVYLGLERRIYCNVSDQNLIKLLLLTSIFSQLSKYFFDKASISSSSPFEQRFYILLSWAEPLHPDYQAQFNRASTFPSPGPVGQRFHVHPHYPAQLGNAFTSSLPGPTGQSLYIFLTRPSWAALLHLPHQITRSCWARPLNLPYQITRLNWEALLHPHY